MQGSCGVAQIKRRRAEKSILSRKLTEKLLPHTLSAMSLIQSAIRTLKAVSIHQFALFRTVSCQRELHMDEVMLVYLGTTQVELSPETLRPCDIQSLDHPRLPWISLTLLRLLAS